MRCSSDIDNLNQKADKWLANRLSRAVPEPFVCITIRKYPEVFLLHTLLPVFLYNVHGMNKLGMGKVSFK